MPSLFISYRRADSPDTVKLIHERLKKRLPRWEIFYDHENIPLGEQFPERLRAKVTAATVVLVIIGPKWVEILQERKIATMDHVREEVRLALECGANVVPVLAGRAVMPTDADLADFADLQQLLKRHGRPVRPDPDFDSDLEPIVAHLKSLDSAEAVGTILDDKYTLTQYIDEGGMGVVYAAEQTQPVKRTVAVKLIKPNMDSRLFLARFDAERQALAVMDHPNVAKVFDAGMTVHGRPYFVMEYIKGTPITQYCDDKKLTPQERLNLFIPVCNAVQHAHQKGIIHRDLKPNNVLVEVVDGKPVPKVIDFGLAKALGQKLTDMPFHSVGMRVGTLEYSAPEQAAGRSFDVDTRSDIYSLGVLLYELLTGAPPFTHEELLKVGEEEMRRVIREVEPTTPSKKLSSSGELPAIAASRHLEPGKLTRLVQGDLDWIVMKCLEKENARRYETANQLGQELQRFLADEPVQAGPPSASYRIKKFLKRNRGPTIATTVILLALLLGIAASTGGLLVAERAVVLERAAMNKALAAAEEETKAKIAAQQSQAAEHTAKIKAMEAAALAEKRLERIDKANSLLLSIFTDVDPAAGREGTTLQERISKRLDEFVEKLVSDKNAESEVNSLIPLQNSVALLLISHGKTGRAIELLNKAHTKGKVKAIYPAQLTGELAKYNGIFGSQLPKLEYDPEALTTMSNLAYAYRVDGKLEQAIVQNLLVLKYRREMLGTDDPDTLASVRLLADAECANGEYSVARVRLESVLPKTIAAFGANHPETLAAKRNLAETYLAEKSLRGKAIPLLKDYLDLRGRQLSARHLGFEEKICRHAFLFGLEADIEPIIRTCLEIRIRSDPGDWLRFNTSSALGGVLLGQKKYADAEAPLKEGYEGMKQREKAIPAAALPRLTEALERLVQLYDATGNVAEADRYRKELAARKEAEKEPKK